jgi:ATP-dependent DNA ligase
VRLITRGGYDWSRRYPWIVEAARKNRHRQFAIDGDAVVLGVDGIADFNVLDSVKSMRRHWRRRRNTIDLSGWFASVYGAS